MRLRETLHQVVRDITDTLMSQDSDPEHIKAFPHLPECSRTRPLEKTVNFEGPIPSWSNLGMGTELVNITISCSECGATTINSNL